MGEVYRATDTKLGRDVAIKVLPSAVAQDPERLARFQREAQALAALQHPNIASIYGLEELDGQPVSEEMFGWMFILILVGGNREEAAKILGIGEPPDAGLIPLTPVPDQNTFDFVGAERDTAVVGDQPGEVIEVLGECSGAICRPVPGVRDDLEQCYGILRGRQVSRGRGVVDAVGHDRHRDLDTCIFVLAALLEGGVGGRRHEGGVARIPSDGDLIPCRNRRRVGRSGDLAQ